jgi:intein/homing endonuclease
VSQQLVKNNKYLIDTPDGWSQFSGVRKTVSNGSITLFTNSGKSLECTPNHLLYGRYGWMSADTLDVGDVIMTVDDYEHITHIHVDVFSSMSMYDALEVSSKSQYFTGGILSHNCNFLGSSGTLIEGSKLKNLVSRNPFAETQFMKVYEQPIKDHVYACIVDVSRGKGLDYSAFHIIDVTSMPYKQVCVYRDNTVTPIDYAEIIYRSIKQYNSAYTLIEVNDIGEQVAEVLYYEFEVETVLFTESAGRSGKRISAGFSKGADKGIRTTKSVKAVGCNMLKMLIEQDQLIVNDFQTINELSTFSRKGISYEAESGCNDDLVMGLVLFAWMTDQLFFREITDINTLDKLRSRNEEELMESLLPIGFNNFDDDEIIEDPMSGSKRWLQY